MKTIAVIGLGYVGLPLALHFAKHFPVVGYDINELKITAYKNMVDPSDEVSYKEFEDAIPNFVPTTDITKISSADFIIIAMPTPVDHNNVPDFTCLIEASALVGAHMKQGATIIYESTVYPGATEEVCVPELEKASGKKWLEDFFIGYSPERISPGDKVMSLTKLTKIVSGDTEATLGNVASLYETIIEAGVFRAASVRVAEAAKVVENIQRDVNIALMNELSTIFHKLDLDTNEVVDAAASKWNFANYRPGLVGGHCIGVDPYYLIHKALTAGHTSPFLNQARVVNNSMSKFVARETTKHWESTTGKNVAILGLTFKENCMDIRNSKVFDLVFDYKLLGMNVYCFDPVADEEQVFDEYGVVMTRFEDIPVCDLVVLAAPHKQWTEENTAAMINKTIAGGVFADLKGRLDKSLFEYEPIKLWRL
jgi:UDP-N-acetyl-D-galactosamine dehydrogenase